MTAVMSPVEQASELLFGKDGIGASNFKLFLGSDRDATSDSVATEIKESLERVVSGQAEEIEF